LEENAWSDRKLKIVSNVTKLEDFITQQMNLK